MSEGLQLFLLALLGSIVALAGGVIFLFNQKWADYLEEHSVPFAAGVLLTVSLLGLLPEAVHEAGENAFGVMLITFVAAYLFENILFRVHHHESGKTAKGYASAVPLVIIGDTIHNFIDGVAIASSFMLAPGLGLVTAISTFLHEVPHEVSDFGILLKTGWKRKKVLLVNILSASATILGAFLVRGIISEGPILGYLLAMSSGLFLYLGASDFLPHIEFDGKQPWVAIAPFIIGIVAMYTVISLVPHGN